MRHTSRRTFVTTAASAVGALVAGLPSGWTGGLYANDAPETRDMRFGVVAVTDCAPIITAHERGYFRAFGINSVISKEPSWAVVRDRLALGVNQATQMLIGMPFASTMRLPGSAMKPLVIPWLLNRNGQAITVSHRLKAAGATTPALIRPLADAARASGEPLTFAMTFPTGTHAMWIRYWLASGGIHPDRHVNLIAIPPAQMVASMKMDRMDGFCVGEPWNTRAVADHVGFTAMTTQQLWRDHPEKVCAFTEEFAEHNPRTVKAVLKALHLASVDLDRMDEDRFGTVFSKRHANYPHQIYGAWWLTQFRRWGMVRSEPDYAGVPRRVLRSDLYLDAMRELGVETNVAEERTITLFDGTFDGTEPGRYARSFPVNSIS